MQTLDRPLDDDDKAMADLAEVADWTKVAGPDTDDTGRDVVLALINRVSAATGWEPWPVDQNTVIDNELDAWGFRTSRGTEIAVYNDQLVPDSPRSGWAAYDLGPDDIAAAEAGLDAHWQAKFDLARQHWGEPAYVGTDSNPGFVDEWAPAAGFDKRHLAVWVRPGAQFHLYSNQPTKDPLSESVGINYSVYLNEERA
ncbi:MAG: hypothetical protein ACRDP9_19320 [Kribbellaceae bacterium]|jgi:hypothetical protein|nr:hypothetical protein [Kribbellaceae bacterium]